MEVFANALTWFALASVLFAGIAKIVELVKKKKKNTDEDE